MNTRVKMMYLNVLLNVRNNAYENNRELLKSDLITLRKLLTIEQENEKMQKLEKSMQKVLTRSR